MGYFETIVISVITLTVGCLVIIIHPEPFQEVRRKSVLRVIKITTVGGDHYWQIQKRLPIINIWVNAVEDMWMWYDELRFDNSKSALEYIELHYSNKKMRQNSKSRKIK